MHVGDIDHEPHGVAQRAAGRLDDGLHVLECLANAGLGAIDRHIRRRIDAAHAGDENEVAGAHTEAPGAGRLDGAGWRKDLDVVCGHGVTFDSQQCATVSGSDKQ